MNPMLEDIFKSVILLSGITTVSPTEEFDGLLKLGEDKQFITTTLLALAAAEIGMADRERLSELAKVTAAGLKLGAYSLNLLSTLEDAGIEVDDLGFAVKPESTDEEDIPF